MGGWPATEPFLAGGCGGLLYQKLLQAGVDALPSGGGGIGPVRAPPSGTLIPCPVRRCMPSALEGAWPLCLWKIACMRIGVSLGPRFRHMRIPSKRVRGMAVWWSGRLAYLTCNVHSTVSDRGEKLRRTLVSLWGHHQQSSLSLCARGVTP